MKKTIHTLAWAFFFSALLFGGARYLQPALFSVEAFYGTIALACIFSALYVARKRYE